MEHGPVVIVDFPMNSMVIFHSYVKLPEGNEDFITMEISHNYGDS